jgi:CHAT domain-containing protein
MRCHLIALALFICCWPASAQTSAADALAAAVQRIDRQDTSGAQPLLERALELAIAENNRPVEAETRTRLAIILTLHGRYQDSDAQLVTALKLFQQLGDTRGAAGVQATLGKNAWANGRSSEGRAYYEQSLAAFEALGDLKIVAQRHSDLTFFTSGEERMMHIQRGLELARKTDARLTEAHLLHSWADGEYGSDDFDSAFERLEQARSILEELGARADLARVLTSIGRLYRVHGHADQAFLYYQRARDIQKEAGDRQGMIQSLQAMGVALLAQKRFSEALRYDQEGLQLARETGSNYIIKVMLVSVANCYVRLQQYAKAVELLEEARTMPTPSQETLALLSDVRFHLGQYEAALRAAQECFDLGLEFGEQSRSALRLRAQALFKLGRLPEALQDVRQFLQSAEQAWSKLVPADYMKQRYADSDRQQTSLAIQVLLASGEQREALTTAEQARSRAFLDLIATKKTASPNDLLAYLLKRGLGTAETGPLSSRSLAHAASFDDMQAVAARLDSTILTYWVDETSTVVWTISPQGRITSSKSDVGKETLTRWIEEATGASVRPSVRGDVQLASRANATILARRDTRSAWRSLYDVLVGPVRMALPAKPGSLLTIIPSGPLFGLSFAALLNDKGRYLIEDYALHYSPAVEVFRYTSQTKQQVSDLPARYLLVANPSSMPAAPDGKPLPPLPGSEREVNSISRLLPPDVVSTLSGTRADERSVRSAMPAAKVIHLATHGIVNGDDPLNSFLALGRTGDQPGGDGRLTVGEVYGLDLHADLVVLSACRSGAGPISSDGVAGLSRAFFYAGTASLVSTLWDVADHPAAELVTDFYRLLGPASGSSKSSALRSAQLRLLASLRKGQLRVDTPFGKLALPEDPILWAGFVLMGEP